MNDIELFEYTNHNIPYVQLKGFIFYYNRWRFISKKLLVSNKNNRIDFSRFY